MKSGAYAKATGTATRKQRKLPDISNKSGLAIHRSEGDLSVPTRSHSPTSRQSVDSGRSTPRSLRSSSQSARSSRSSLRKSRKLPKPNSGQTASVEWETDDSESGYWDIIHAASAELLSADDLTLLPDTSSSPSLGPQSIVEVQPGQFLTSRITQTNHRPCPPTRTVFGVTFAEHQNITFNTTVISTDCSSDEFPQQNSSNSTLHGSQDDVVQAILEADRAMQEMMASGSGGTQFRVQPDQLDSWYQSTSEGVTVENGEPVRVLLLDHNAQTTSLTDSAKEALKKSPGSQQGVVNMSGGGGNQWAPPDDDQITRVSMMFDEDGAAREQASPDQRLSPDLWMHENQASGSTRRQVEVVAHEVDVTRHVLKPNTELDSDDARSVEENEQPPNELDDTLDNEDVLSWPSGVTEPEPDTVSSTCDSGTQTLRHRKTQTQSREDSTTQTPAHLRRRKLPSVPANGSLEYDTDGTESLISIESNELEPSTQRFEGANGPMVGTQTKQRGLTGRKSRKLPSVNGCGADHGSESDGADTNPSLLNTIRHIGTGPHMPPGAAGHTMEGSLHLGSTRDTAQQPQYIMEYQRYIEAFDGTESGPFMPMTLHEPLEDTVFMNGDGTLQSRGRSAQTPLQLQRQRNNTSMPNTMPQDSAGEAGNANINMIVHQTLEDLYNRSTQTSPLLRPRNFSNASDGSGRRRPMSAGMIRTDSEKEMKNQGPRTAIVQQPQSPGLHSMPARANTFDTLFSGDPHTRRAQMGAGGGREKARSWDVIDTDGPFSDRSLSRDFSQQTPITHCTQTPLRIKLGSAGDPPAPRGTITMGDTFVFDSDPDSHPVLQPWSVIGPMDLDITAARDFATQTFGQMYSLSHSHAQTQTPDALINAGHYGGSGQLLMASQQGYQEAPERLSPVHSHTITPRQASTDTGILSHPQTATSGRDMPDAQPSSPFTQAARPQPQNMPFNAYQLSTSEGLEAPGQPGHMAHTPKSKAAQSSHPQEHSSTARDPSVKGEDAKDIFQERPKRHHKREKPKTRSPERNYDKQSVTTAQSNISRKDLLKLMLSQVKQLRRQVDPDRDESRSKSPVKDVKDRKRSKSKEKRSKHRDRSEERETLDDPDKLYNKRRMEMMYSRPHMAAAEVDSLRHRRRRHSVESYHSEKDDDHLDAGRSAREHYQKFRDQYVPKSRWSANREESYFPRPRVRVPPRRAVTPPPVHRRGPPPYNKYLYDRPGTGSLMGRDLPPHRRQLPQVPVREMSFAPPPQRHHHMRPPMHRPMIHPQPQHHHAMGQRMGAPPQMMPPPPPVMNMGPGVPMQGPPPPVQLGQGAFRPISMQEAQQMGTPAQQGTPVVFMPPNQVPPSPHAPYIVIASPYRYDSVSDSAPEAGEVRKARPRKPRAESPHHRHRGTPLDKATRAAKDMKNLTEKLHRSTPMKS